MRGVSTFGAFTTARLGIYAAQKGLDVTGHNITNINTKGYTRQRLDQMSLRLGGADRYAPKNTAITGTGVLCTGVSQLRDPFLDIRYRNELSSVGSMDAKLSGLDELVRIFDEVGKGDGKGVLEAQFNDLAKQIKELMNHAGEENFDSLVRSSSSALVKLLNNFAGQLETVKENQELGFEQDIDTVNDILKNIANLNDSISSAELRGDGALELRDQRNLLLDELSQYTKINVSYNSVNVGAGHTVEEMVIRLGGSSEGDPDDSRAVLINGSFYTQFKQDDNRLIQNPKYDPSNILGGLYEALDGGYTSDAALAKKESNPDYQPAHTKANAFLAALGGFTNDPTLAAKKANQLYDATYLPGTPDYDPNNPKAFPYLDEKGNVTKDATKAALQENPDYDPNSTEGALYLKPDGGLTSDPAEAKPVGNQGYDADSHLSMRYLTYNGDPTNDRDKADKLPYALNLEALKTKEGKLLANSNIVELGDNDLYGALQSTREMLSEAGEFSNNSMLEGGIDLKATTKRGIPYYQKNLDALAAQFAKVLNGTNQGYLRDDKGNYVDSDGKFIDSETLDPVTNKPLPLNVSMKNMTQTELDKLELNGVKPTGSGVLFSSNSDADNTTGITAKNISISKSWSTGDVRIVNSFLQGSTPGSANTTANDNITHILVMLDSKQDYLPSAINGNAASPGTAYFRGSFQEMLSNTSGILANDVKSTATLLDNYVSSANEIEVSRLSISGVDLNDEASSLMQYQKSYVAACRLMTTLDEALDKLINSTGIVGR